MIEVVDLRQKAEHLDEAVKMFWNQWGSSTNYNFYYDCMRSSSNGSSDLPRFYIAVENNLIVGTYALLRNDLISRQDLTPWFACLYVVPERRGNGIGTMLLEHALLETNKLGYPNLYLCTNLEGYYEKHGWSLSATGYMFDGEAIQISEKATSSIGLG